MGKELVISSDRHETRLAILEDGQLVEIYFQRGQEYSLAGSIHKGRVTRVLPGMQSAFVDVGLERDTFLYVSDFFEEGGEDVEKVSTSDERRGDERRDRGERGDRGDRRERFRDRGGRDNREQRPAPVEAAPAAAAVEAAPAEGDGVTAPASSVAPSNGGREDRKFRDRGRRRRRGNGGRFPDSKFAAPGAEAESVVESEPVEVDAGAEEPVLEPIVLPGESLSKYRRAASGVEDAEPAADFEDDESPVDAEPPQLIARVPEPDAPIHHPVMHEGELPVEAVVEQEASEIEEPEPEPVIATVADFAEEIADTEPAFEAAAEAPAPTTEAPEAIEAVGEIVEDASADLDSDAGIADGDEAVDTPEGAENASAQVRAQDGRYLEQRSGRRRRRGRRDRGDRRPNANPAVPGVEAASPAIEEASTEVAGVTPEAEDAVLLPGETRGERREAPPVEARRGERDGRRDERGDGRRDQRGEGRRDDRGEGRREERSEGRKDDHRDRQTPLITDLLKEGQEILVQIAKEPLGQKGARITSHIALPGRYCVYMPTVEHTGVSRKIASDEERHRLKKILLTHKAGLPGGFIIRTAGEGRTEDEIAADIQYLYNLWLDIRQKAEKKKAPAVIYHDLDIVERTLRDQLSDEFKAIWCDSEDVYENVVAFVQRMTPALVNRVKMYTRDVPIFDSFAITSELEKALRPKVWLKSGGYIVINQTEALVAIDINTGKFIGKSNRLEDTIVRTNIDAVKEIVRQVRLRDLGGIIVIDFIDMDERKNRQKVMQALEEAMRADRAPYKILQFNDFGLVAITRKRVKQSLERTLCQPCSYCEGSGYIRSVQTVIGEILVEARKIAAAVEGKECLLRVNPEVATVLKATSNTYLEELEEILKRPVAVVSDPLIHHEKFDLS